MSVSIITPCQNTRIPNLFLLKEMILAQTYLSKIIEWVIIDGSKYADSKMDEHISELKDQLDIPITYISHENGAKIGKIRNKANEAATGDILVCMDDDDYYPPTRVQEAWDNLTKSDCLIAGVTESCMYDFTFDKQYKMLPVADYHSPNNAMAYKREYIKNHKHDETVDHNEEQSFTNKFSEPLIQLKSEKTVVVSSHSHNTYNKRPLIVNFYKGRFPKMYEYDRTIIPQDYYEKMKTIFTDVPRETYDIVYFCGEGIAWKPTDEGLGGSEQAVRYLSEEWVKSGRSVMVYGNVPECVHNGVTYSSWVKFPYDHNFKLLIVWRLPGMFYINIHPIKANKIYLDLHDNVKLYSEFPREFSKFERVVRPFDKIMFKSEYHLSCFELHLKIKLNADKYLIIPNGLRVSEFNNKIGETRDPNRFCYCSSYSRGLDNILKCMWPNIIKKNPRAELHLYYGMNLESAEQKKYLTTLISNTQNVMDHGRQPLSLIKREKEKSTYQLYFNSSEFEIDCINIREGILSGCIPIIFDELVYAERDGIKFNIDFFTQNGSKLGLELGQVGSKIGNMTNEISSQELENMREMLTKSKLLIDWRYTAMSWIIEKNYLPRAPINCTPGKSNDSGCHV
jgi:glycosyltransferase involved in cell wall biosynthesis